MAKQVILVGVDEAAQIPWQLTPPADVVVERCEWTRLKVRVRAAPAALVLAPLPADVVTPIVYQMKALASAVPIIVALDPSLEHLRSGLNEAGATEVLVAPTPEDILRVLQPMLTQKPAPVEEVSAAPGGWPSTTFDPAACEQALKQFVVSSAVPDIPGAVPFADLMPYCKGLTEADRAALTQSPLVAKALVAGLRLHGVARSAARERAAGVDASALAKLKSEVAAVIAELDQTRATAPSPLAADLERRSVRLGGAWREVEELQRNYVARPVTATAVPSIKPVAPKPPPPPPPSVKPAAPEPSKPPSFALNKRPNKRARALAAGAIILVVAVILAWESVTYLWPWSDGSRFQGIPSVTSVGAQNGRGIVYVAEDWVADPSHIDALKRELSERGLVEAQIFKHSSNRMLVELTMAPAGK